MDLRSVEFAHDLKMPIQLIYSCVQLLEMELQADGKAKSYLKMLMQSANQLQRMVVNVLEDDRLQRQKNPLRLENCDVVAEIRDICCRTAIFADEKRVRVAFSSNAAEFVMKTDSEKLSRILHNLLSNALRFTPEEGKITVCVCVLGDAVEISVSDTGCGVRDAGKVFDRGYTTGGTGHGLAIVREYASLLGGGVSLHSNEAGGSCFVLRLPV